VNKNNTNLLFRYFRREVRVTSKSSGWDLLVQVEPFNHVMNMQCCTWNTCLCWELETKRNETSQINSKVTIMMFTSFPVQDRDYESVGKTIMIHWKLS